MDIDFSFGSIIWGILAAAVAAQILGAVWYSPAVLGRAWMRAAGLTDEAIGAAKARGMVLPYLLNFIAALMTAYILAMFLAGVLATTVAQGLQTALYIWLGFVLPIILGAVLWEGKRWSLLVINGLYYLLSLSLMATVLMLWGA